MTTLRDTARQAICKRLSEELQIRLEPRVEDAVVDVAVMLVIQQQRSFALDQISGLRARNAVLREALAIHRTKARIALKAATTWEQRFNRLRKEQQR